ncbi:hypothetical protein [Thermocrispum agreste]|nr:hypothetical protein [Thermocrispum agreste]
MTLPPSEGGLRGRGGGQAQGIAPGGCVRPDEPGLPKGGGTWGTDDGWDTDGTPPDERDETPADRGGSSSMGIGPGGCIPPDHWPKDTDYGPLGAGDLHADIDWMTWSHEELYLMATQGLDVAGANAVAAKWGDVGVLLQEIADDLDRAARKSEAGWEGSAAELARKTAAQLARWAEDTGGRAHEAGTCVSRQTDIAVRAAREMPEPVLVPEQIPMPTPSAGGTGGVAGGVSGGGSVALASSGGTMAMSASSGGTMAMSASDGVRVLSPSGSPFVSQDLSNAGLLVQDPWGPLEKSRAAHRRAAEVMRTMQRESAEVYGSVPWFTPLKQEVPDDRRRRPDDEPRAPRVPDQPPRTTTSAASGAAVATGAGAAGAISGTVGAVGGVGSLGGGAAGGTPGGSGSLGGGAHSGVLAGGNAGAPAAGPAAAAAGAGAGAGARGMGAMPVGAMGAGAAGGRSDDRSHKRSTPVAGEEGIFDVGKNDIQRRLLGEAGDDEPPRRF